MASLATPMASLSILLAEDEKLSRDLLTFILTKKYPDIPIHCAVNGKEGLALFIKHSPAIVITDINMPEMTGLEMANEIRSLKGETKVVILTADTGKMALDEAIAQGVTFDHFVVKPVVFAVLFAAIDQCLAEIGPTRDR